MDKKELLTIKSNLQQIDQCAKQERERLREKTLSEVRQILKAYFSPFPDTQVYVFGSLIAPGAFYKTSDVDIAVEDHPESRLDLYAALSAQIPYPIDIIIMEKCPFADSIRAHGMRVV